MPKFDRRRWIKVADEARNMCVCELRRRERGGGLVFVISVKLDEDQSRVRERGGDY